MTTFPGKQVEQMYNEAVHSGFRRLYWKHMTLRNIRTGKEREAIRIRIIPVAYTVGYAEADTFEDAFMSAMKQAAEEMAKRFAR